MRLLTIEELRSLLAPQTGPCVSVFLPTHRSQPLAAQDPIRYKNLLKSAEKLLLERYVGREIKELLGPLASLSEPEFWRHQLDGLAIFRSADLSVFFRLPMALPELAVVADSFHVKPLLGFLKAHRRYYVLALSPRRVTLYTGTPFGLGPVDLRGLPSSLAGALGVPRREKSVSLHGSGRGAPVFHGKGAPEVSRKDELVKFFRALDAALWEELRDERVPLFLAGSGTKFPIFREISRYAFLAPGGIEGNFDEATPEELHAKAWPVVEAAFRKEEDEVLAEYQRLVSRRLATDILTQVTGAAVHGRVRRLFLNEAKRLFGRMDPVTGEVVLSGAPVGPMDDDVLDDLAEAVIARRGDVFQLAPDRMPGGAAAAAILRW